MGMEIDCLQESEVIASIIEALDAGRGGWVATPNVDHLRTVQRDPALRALCAQADLVVPDGMPLVWASRVAGNPLVARVAGSDLVWSLSAEAALRDKSVYLLGGAAGACEAARARLRRFYPGLSIAGAHSPAMGFEARPDEMDEIRRRLRQAGPDIVYIALGFPKQEYLISQLAPEFPSTWFLGVGISLSFVGGQVARAPEWLIRLGLEWTHRLVQEPRRLAKRYLVDNLPFALRLLAHAAICRVRGRGARARPVAGPIALAAARPDVVFTHGSLERARAAEVEELLPAAVPKHASAPRLAAEPRSVPAVAARSRAKVEVPGLPVGPPRTEPHVPAQPASS